MKSVFLTTSFLLWAAAAFGQGTVSFINTTGTKITTNAMAIGGTNGFTSPLSNGFYYALFTAPFGATNTDLTSGLWTFTGIYARALMPHLSNPVACLGIAASALSAGGVTVNGGGILTMVGFQGQIESSNTVTVNRPGTLNLLGNNSLNGLVFDHNGGGTTGLPPFPLFGSAPTPAGTPLTSGFTLYSVINGSIIIQTQPADETVIQGSNATFTVQASDGWPLSYQWLFNGGNIQDATNSSVTILGAQPTDAGGYSVVMSDPYNSVTSRVAALTVLIPTPPSITAQPQDQMVPLGSNALFNVSVDGTPPFTYQWSFNGRAIRGATFSGLSLTNAQRANSGHYSVAVTNLAGDALSDAATLTVMAAPGITNQPVSTTGYWGKSVTLSAGATGTGPLSYQWYKDGNLITGATNASLSLNDLQLTDAGGFTVVVSNAYGTVTSSSATLIVNPAGVSLGMYAGVTIDGTPGKTFAIQFSTNVAQSGSWMTLTNLTLSQPVELWVDTNINVSAPGHPSGSYRVLAVP